MELTSSEARSIAKKIFFGGAKMGAHLNTLHSSWVSAETLKRSGIQDVLEMHRDHHVFGEMVKKLLERFDRISKGEKDAWNDFLEKEFNVAEKKEEPVVPKENRKFSIKKEKEIKKISSGKIQKKHSVAHTSGNEVFKKMDHEELKKMMEEDNKEFERERGEAVHPNFYRSYLEDYY